MPLLTYGSETIVLDDVSAKLSVVSVTVDVVDVVALIDESDIDWNVSDFATGATRFPELSTYTDVSATSDAAAPKDVGVTVEPVIYILLVPRSFSFIVLVNSELDTLPSYTTVLGIVPISLEASTDCTVITILDEPSNDVGLSTPLEFLVVTAPSIEIVLASDSIAAFLAKVADAALPVIEILAVPDSIAAFNFLIMMSTSLEPSNVAESTSVTASETTFPSVSTILVAKPMDLAVVNVEDLNVFEAGSVVTIETLQEKGLVKKVYDGLKVLGNGTLTKALTVKAANFSVSAKEAIEKAGGTAEKI